MQPFVSDDNTFLAFCLTCKTSGIAGSVRLEIEDGVLALDLDTAVAIRLLQFENECRKADAKMIAYEVSKIFGDGSENEATSDFATAEIW